MRARARARAYVRGKRGAGIGLHTDVVGPPGVYRWTGRQGRRSVREGRAVSGSMSGNRYGISLFLLRQKGRVIPRCTRP